MAELFIENEEELNYTSEVVDEVKEVKEVEEKTVTCLLNCRAVPEGEVLKVYNAGEKVKVLAVNGEWTQTEDGWVMSQFLG